MAHIFFKKADYINYLRSKGEPVENISDTPYWWNDPRGDAYKAAAKIPGCTIGFAWSDIYHSDNPEAFLVWKDTRMKIIGCVNDKTRPLVLFDTIDLKGYRVPLPSHSSDKDKPNNIGTPTAKKLDEWRTFLLNKRKEDEMLVESVVTAAENQKSVCRAMFPNGSEQQSAYQPGTWSFSHEQNGIRYSCEIFDTGTIQEDVKIIYEPHQKDSNIVKAFLMMQNAYTPLKKQTA